MLAESTWRSDRVVNTKLGMKNLCELSLGLLIGTGCGASDQKGGIARLTSPFAPPPCRQSILVMALHRETNKLLQETFRWKSEIDGIDGRPAAPVTVSLPF